MLVICSAVDRSLHTTKDARRQKTACYTVSVSDAGHQEPETLFTLVGKSVCLQQRFAFVPSNQETVLHFRSQNKNYSCFVDSVSEQTERETKINTQTISGGVQRASVHRRQEQKSSTEVVFQKKTKLRNRSVTIRQPLVMYKMNLPDKHLSYEEASHIFSSTEEAKVMLKRLLASTDHKCMTAESVSTGNVRPGKENQSRLLEKPEYLEGTYDYLFHRHVQTLNDVIQQQELQDDEAHGIYQQKNHKQVIQLCCGEATDCDDDASVTIGSTKSSSHHNTSPACYYTFSCDEVMGNNNQDTNQNINSNDFFDNTNSCDVDKVNDHCEEKESTNVIDNNQIGSCHYIKNNGDNSINLNPVTRKMNALKLKEVRSSSKPIITVNHVSTVNESSSTYTESESNKLRQINTTSTSSTIRSRSSSPLLEVPVALEDLTTEMMRPPLN